MKNNPREIIRKTATIGTIRSDDCCCLCDEFIPAGTSDIVIIPLYFADVSHFGRNINKHMHVECWRRAGRYPPVVGLENPILRKNQWQAVAIPLAAAAIPAAITAGPRLLEFTERHPTMFRILPWNWGRNPARVIECRKITKGKEKDEGIHNRSYCDYCHQRIFDGEECMRVKYLYHTVYMHPTVTYIHLDCYAKAGYWPRETKKK